MTTCRCDDDNSLSGDLIVIEEAREGVTPQALWVGVREVYHDSTPGEVMVQICYQEAHLGSPLAGPVWITPQVWRQLDRGVRRRLRRRRWQDMKRKWRR